MEDLFNNIVEINTDYVFPISFRWKKVYEYATKYLKENCKKNYEELQKRLDKFLNVLIKDGDVYEDVVLKTSLYYFLGLNSSFEITSVQESTSVTEGVSILLNKANFKKIFTNEKYKYLNKIELAYLISILQDNQPKKDIVNFIEIHNECETIKKSYKNKCNNKLYRLLVEIL